MNQLKKMILGGSIARAILIAFLLISIIPIVLISGLFIDQSNQSLTERMEENLQILVESKAEEINIKLNEVVHTTKIAHHHAEQFLQSDAPLTNVEARLERYQPDHRAIIGLDVFFNENGGASVMGENLSNVYWNHTDIPPSVARQIIQTEELDPIFEGIKLVSPDTQWIYMTTSEGMMRLYPWADNDHYPDNWDPREIIFYTVAMPENNPTLQPQWTPPYVDFAGAGWMVTLSIPMLNESSEFIGVMSHDVTINSLKEIALDINVLDGAGYGFLINAEGGVVAHPDFQDDDASKGTQEEANLLHSDNDEFRNLIQQMVDGGTGSGYFTDEANGEQVLVYAPIDTIDWSIGIIVPRTEVIAPAMQMRSRALVITMLLIVAAVALSVLLTRMLHRPLQQLLQGVNQIIEERQADEIEIPTFHELGKLAAAFNEMSAKVWQREKDLKAKVAKLSIQIDTQRKQKELESIVETDYFRHLEINAERLRNNIKNLESSSK